MKRAKKETLIEKEEPTRFQFRFTKATENVLRSLQEETGATSMTEVIKNALVLYNWAKKTAEEGGDLFVIDNHGIIREVVLPFHMEKMQKNKESKYSMKISELAEKKSKAAIG